MPTDILLLQCIHYFKSNPGFKKVFEKLREKYRSFGHVGGIIHLEKLTSDEKEALSGFLCKDYYSKKSASIQVEHFAKALEQTRFQGVDLNEVVKLYFGEDLISKKEEKEQYRSEKEAFFTRILIQFKDTRAAQWLQHVLDTGENAYRLMSKSYDENSKSLCKDLRLTCEGINRLSLDKEHTLRLALFSSGISKNPHCFDDSTQCGKLLLYGAAYFLGKPYPQNAEEKAELLYTAGIIPDEVSNFTTCSGLIAYARGKEHAGWMGFYKEAEPLQVSLYNLSTLDSIQSPHNKVFVFENPTVFSQVLYSTQHQNPSLVCTYGQVKLASLILLDKLAEYVEQIYYSGDMDPEGLVIADKLKQRYGEKLILWGFSVENYMQFRSDERIEATRLKKMDKLASPELKELAAMISQQKFAAYQELLVERYVEDVLKVL